MKKSVCLVLFSLLFFLQAVNAQNDFETFRKQKNDEFERFRREKEADFADFLRNKWEEFEVFKGRQRRRLPGPTEIPQAPASEVITTNTLPDEKIQPEPEPKHPDQESATSDTIEFLGHSLPVHCGKVATSHLSSLSENDVADYWIELKRVGCDELVYQCKQIKKDLGLNDWGIYLWLKNIAEKVYMPSQLNEKIIFIAYVMDACGYEVQLAATSNFSRLLLLMMADGVWYEHPYMELSGVSYYIIDGIEGEKYKTYKRHKGKEYKLPVRVTLSETLRTKGETSAYKMFMDDPDGPIKIAYDKIAVDFYAQLPHCDLSVYFNSECSETITASLKEEFTKKLRGLSEVEKVSKLLCFMHQHSPYMEDYQQFGFEKFFFFEEYFSYPYSDCEDNSILFAYLVRKLTNCKVIGLEYDDHVATAVRFEEEVNGSYIVFNGEKYVICDPTYFGAPIGKYMPGYQNKKAKIIEIR